MRTWRGGGGGVGYPPPGNFVRFENSLLGNKAGKSEGH